MEGKIQRTETEGTDRGKIHKRREGGKETERNIQERGEKKEGERKGTGMGTGKGRRRHRGDKQEEKHTRG